MTSLFHQDEVPNPVPHTASDNVRVFCRFRPLGSRDERMCASYPSAETVKCNGPSNHTGSAPVDHHFSFDTVYRPDATQERVFDEVAQPVIGEVLDGYNGTILVYGQTGSGKTHTMMGAHGPGASRAGATSTTSTPLIAPTSTPSRHTTTMMSPLAIRNPNATPIRGAQKVGNPEAGIVPRTAAELFHRIENLPNKTVTVKLSFVEIYMEKVRDLIAATDEETHNLDVRENPETKAFYIDGCVFEDVATVDDVLALVGKGLDRRKTSATRMNDVSSRSHCLLCLEVTTTDHITGVKQVGKMYLVDLAGSERASATGGQGQRFEEGKEINKSLTQLGTVINNLTDKSCTFVSYRNSVLTRILKDSLGGNSKTALIVCCSPSMSNHSETLSTLRFGERAKKIKNKAVVNTQLSYDDLKRENDRLHEEIARLSNGGSSAAAEATNKAHGARVSELELHIESLEAQLSAARRELEDGAEKVHVANKALKEMTNKHDEKDRQLSSLMADAQNLHNSIQTASADVAAERQKFRERIDHLEQKVMSYRTRTNDLKAELAASSEKLTDSNQKTKTLEANILNLEAKHKEELKTVENEVEEKTKAICAEELQMVKKDATEKEDSLRQLVVEKESALEDLHLEVKSAVDAREEAVTKAAQLQASLLDALKDGGVSSQESAASTTALPPLPPMAKKKAAPPPPVAPFNDDHMESFVEPPVAQTGSSTATTRPPVASPTPVGAHSSSPTTEELEALKEELRLTRVDYYTVVCRSQPWDWEAFYNLACYLKPDEETCIKDVPHTKIDCYGHVLHLNPKMLRGWLNVANMLKAHEQSGGVTTVRVGCKELTKEECYVRALSLDSNLYRTWYNLAVVSADDAKHKITVADNETKEFNRAACFVEVLKRCPEHEDAWVGLGASLPPFDPWTGVGTMKFDTVPQLNGPANSASFTVSKEECFKKALALNPNNQTAQRHLNNMAHQQERAATRDANEYCSGGKRKRHDDEELIVDAHSATATTVSSINQSANVVRRAGSYSVQEALAHKRERH